MDNYLVVNTFIMLGFMALIACMAVLVLWARRRTKGVLAVGALFSVLAPDPTMEQKIVMVEQAKVNQNEEDEQGGE